MSAKSCKVLQMVSGWQAVELILQCLIMGTWQFLKIVIKRLWKGHRRKYSKNYPPVELTVDSSIGTHCYIKIMGVKYHYVETGPKSGQLVLILGDAPDTRNNWGPNWTRVIKELSDAGHHIITLDLRGTGGSEGGRRTDLSPPRAVEELSCLMKALGVTENTPAVVIGIGIGGMLTWYLVHCCGSMINKFAVIGAPHPNLYWQYPPAKFCQPVLHFIQWPHLPEQWLADGELQGGEGRWASSRACDWSGALNYIRGAAWWRIAEGQVVSAAGLVVGAHENAAQVVASAAHCSTVTLRLVARPHAADAALPPLLLDFLLGDNKVTEAAPRGLMGRMLGAVAGRVLPPQAAIGILKTSI